MPKTNPTPDAIDEFLEAVYNKRKDQLMSDEAQGSLLEFSKLVAERLAAKNADWSWRTGYVSDIKGAKYSTGLSGRKAIQVGLGYEWGDDPASAYAMVALAFSGFWNPSTQDAEVFRELLRELAKLKTANLAKLLAAIRNNDEEILGVTENPVWLHLLALQELYDFDDTDLAANTALSIQRISEMEEGALLADYELKSLADYLNLISDEDERNYSLDTLSELQLCASDPAEFSNPED